MIATKPEIMTPWGKMAVAISNPDQIGLSATGPFNVEARKDLFLTINRVRYAVQVDLQKRDGDCDLPPSMTPLPMLVRPPSGRYRQPPGAFRRGFEAGVSGAAPPGNARSNTLPRRSLESARPRPSAPGG